MGCMSAGQAVGDASSRFEKLLPFFRKLCLLTPPNFEKRNTPNSTVLFDATTFEKSGASCKYRGVIG